jgi:hypothetical protein
VGCVSIVHRHRRTGADFIYRVLAAAANQIYMIGYQIPESIPHVAGN